MRFPVLAAAIAALNLIIWLAWVQHGADLPRLAAAARADGEVVAAGQELWWRFDRPMTARDLEREPPARILPPMRGRWRWSDPRTLSFAPAELPPAAPFLVEFIPGRLAGVDGREAVPPPTLHLHAPPLALRSCRAIGSEAGGRYLIEVTFSDAVAPGAAFAHLRLADSSGRALGLQRRGEAGPEQVRIITEPLGDRRDALDGIRLVLRATAGLVGLRGPLGLERDAVMPLTLDPALRLESAHPGSAWGGGPGIELQFNRDCGHQALERVLALEPAMPFSLSGSGSSWRIGGEFASGKRYAVVLSPPAAGMPAGDYPRPDRASVLIPDREPRAWFEHEAGYLGARGHRAVLAHALNLRRVKVSAWRIYDDNLAAWRNGGRSGVERLARPLAEREFTIAAETNAASDLRLALDDLLPPGARGDGAYRLALSWRREDETTADEGWRSREAECLLSLSDIGLQARCGPDGLDAWCWSLAEAAPLADVRLRLVSSKNQPLGEALCDAEGHAHLAPKPLPAGERAAVLVAERGASSDHGSAGLTWLDLGDEPVRDAVADTGGRPFLSGGYEAFVYADRGVYRPGETAHLRALVRDARGQAPPVFPARWRILRPDLRVWRELTALLPADGDPTLDLELPADLPTGHWSAQIGLSGDDAGFGSTPLQLEEFMPQRLRVSLALGAGEQHRMPVADAVVATARGDYLFGAPAVGLEARLDARLEPSCFAPAGWTGWNFGDTADTIATLDHVALAGQRLAPSPTPVSPDGTAVWSLSAATALARLGAPALRPWTLIASASVLEPGGRAVASGSRYLQLDPLPAYLGLALDGEPRLGRALRFALKLVRADGELEATASRQVEVALYREVWNTVLVKDGRYYRYQSQRDLAAAPAPLAVPLTDGIGGGALALGGPGSYALRARDLVTGQIVSLPFYVGGDGGGWSDSISREHPDRCEVTIAARAESPPPAPDLERSLRVGATAAITVRSPFPGRLLLVVESDRILATRTCALTANAMTVELPVEASWLPNAYVTATVVRAVDPEIPWRVHRAFGVVRAPVADPQRRLALAFTAPAEARPGARLTLDLRIAAPGDVPAAGAAATIAAVDEGVLRLTGFLTPDPYAWFTAPRGRALAAYDCYDLLMPEVARPGGESPEGGDRGDFGRYRSPIAATRVRPLSLWSGALHADADGHARIDFVLPATFTGGLRVMAVADHGALVGSAEAAVAVRAPLMVQTSWPRFAAPGDRFRVPVTVFNRGARAGRAALRLELPSADPLLAEEPSREVEVAAGGDAMVAFTVTARAQCGATHARIEALMDGERAVDEVELPVRPASPAIIVGDEVRATPGESARATVPDGFLAGTLAISARLAPSPSCSLPAGLEYLYNYPHGCAEQTVSGCFPLLCLRDIGASIAPGLFSPEGLAERLRVGIERLQTMQCEDGGLAMWAGSREDWPWASVYAAHFLVEARAAKVEVPEAFLARLLGYLRRLGGRGEESWLETQCYAVHVLALAGQPDQAQMHRCEDALRDPSIAERAGPSCRFHLSAAWLAAGRRDLAVALIPDHLPTPRSDRRTMGDLASPTRDRAVLLDTLLDLAPRDRAIPQLARELGKRESWLSTQDTAFAALALGKYLRRLSAEAPFASARLRVDGVESGVSLAGEPLAWQGGVARTLEAVVEAPAGAVGWLSWTATGVPLTPPPPTDHGLIVERSWSDEVGRPKAAFVSGDLVRVTLSVRSAADHRGIALEDLLPAGFEVENPRLEGADASAREEETERVDVRDDRVVLIGDLHHAQGEWVLRHTYLARAVTVGSFVAPPPRAECMYDLSVSGIGASGKVTVEARR